MPTADARIHTFATTPRMSTYLVALIAGPYALWRDVYTDEHGEIPLGIFCRASLAEFMDAERLFTETKQGFGFYHKNFGTPYAFGKYDQLFVPEFNAGAMENAGAVTFLEDYVFRSKVTRASYERRAETVLHEMAHMWFGDLVTMTWWDDLWLNESFATFASVLCQAEATEYTQAWTTFANVEKSWAYRQDQLPSTHPVAADIPDLHAVEVNFDGITYAKGASVLKQLVAYVGLEAFLAGLRDYFRDHAFANATFGDLLGALEKSSGRDLSHWGRQWLKTTGLNTLRADFDVDADGKFTRFAIEQSGAAPGAGETRVHRLAVGIYDDDGIGQVGAHPPRGTRRRRSTHRSSCAARCFARQADPGQRRRPDLLLAAAGSGFAADRAEPHRRHRRTAAPHAGVVGGVGDDPRRRAEGPRLRGAGDERCPRRDRSRCGAAAAAAGADRAELLRRPGLGCRPTAGRRSPTGCWTWRASPRRVRTTSWRSSTRCARRCCHRNHVAVLATLLDNEPAAVNLPGLVIDTDLRWRIVTALAASGDLDADGTETPFIDAEAPSDPTAAGKRNAAAAAAARPQAAVKEAAWQQVIEDDTLANITARAIIGGFVRPGQGELLLHRSRRATSTRSARCGSAAPARSRRPWWSACTRRGTSARPRIDAADAFLADRGSAGAAPAGARRPRRCRAVAAGARSSTPADSALSAARH